MNNRKTKLIIIICLCVVVLGLSIGYALLSASLKISGTAKVESKWDVVFLTDEIETAKTGTAECNIGKVTGTSIEGMSVVFNKPGDACTFTIPVKNTGNIPARLVDVTGKSSNLTFLGDSADQDILRNNVTYEVNYGKTQIKSTTDFSSIPVLDENAKETVTLKATFLNSSTEMPAGEVIIGGLDRSFIYESVVDGEDSGTVAPLVDGIPNPPELNGDMIPVYYEKTSDTTGEWKKADINNTNNDWYDYNNQKWANAVTVKNIVKDLSGNNNDGIINGGAVVGNEEATLDGVDDYIDAGLANYDFKNQITLVLKFKFNAIPSNPSYLFGNWEQAGGGFYYQNNSLYFSLYDSTTKSYISLNAKADETITKDYNILIGSSDGETMNFYVNGEKISKATNITTLKSTRSILVGSDPHSKTGRYFSNITVYDALIFDKVLDEEEIQTHYVDEITLGETKPLVYYNFEDANREYYKKANIGTSINMDDINTMWVWIPRYSYTIKSEDGTNYFGKASFGNNNPTQGLPGEIDVKFISKVTETGNAQYTGNSPTNWRTNEAFDFGDEKRNGIWVGKFEVTGTLASTNLCVNEACNVSKVTIKPGVASLRNQQISSFFYAARSMQNNTTTFGFSDSGDLHMIKNDEWGAVAYLSQSKYGKYGNSDYKGRYKEVYQNKSTTFITGSSNGTPSQGSTKEPQYAYNDMTNLGEGQGQAGVGASTTGNITGIYDMSGGAWEYVMGVLAYYEDNSPMSGNSIAYNSGFTGKVWQNNTYVDFVNSSKAIAFPDAKYYNLYKVSTTSDGMPTIPDVTNSSKSCNGGVCYGQALLETLHWYGDYGGFVYNERPWSTRGALYSSAASGGIFDTSHSTGGDGDNGTTRFVLTP